MQTKITAKRNPDALPIAAASLVASLFLKGPDFEWIETKDVANVQIDFPSGEVLNTDELVARYIARSSQCGLNGVDAFTTTEVDLWTKYVADKKADFADEDKFIAVLKDLEQHTRMRTFLVGYSVTIADIILWAALIPSHHWEGIVKTNKRIKYPHIVRWWTYINELPQFQEVRKKLPAQEKHDHFTSTFGELPGAVMGKVVTRFPPEPSGFLHIGHAKAAFLGDYYAKKYKGKLIVRFDDTNPRKEKEEYEHAILQDLKTMQVDYCTITYTSDYFAQMLEKADELIKIGKAYCDALSADDTKKLRTELKPSPFRDNTVEQNWKMWEQLKAGTEEGQKYSLRAKIDFASDNGTMRDPVIYRYVDIPHNRTGDKFKIYPIYNFACPIVDSIEGVTHPLRSNEYHSSEEQYYWFLENIPGLRKDIKIKDFSRLSFTYTVLSKRKLQYFVDEGLVDGWDDPRFPTIQGVTRRGLRMEALRKFIFAQGDSTNTVNMDITKLWAENKKFIDRIIPRYTVVRKEPPPAIMLLDASALADGTETVQVLLCKHNTSLGMKSIVRSKKIYIETEDASQIVVGEKVTLMDWGNFSVTNISTNENGATVISAIFMPQDTEFKETKKLTWLPAHDESALAKVVLVEYDTLITDKVITKGKDFKDYINPLSKQTTEGFGDPNLNSLPLGTQLQFERVGYFVLDKIVDKVLYFVQTPDGHTVNRFLTKKVAERKT